LNELAAIYEAKGVSPRTAAQVDAELRLDPDVLADPCRRRPRLQRRSRSDRCYPCSLFLLPPAMFRLPVTFVVVLIALGWRVRSAHVSEGAASAAPCCGWWSAARTCIANLYRSSPVCHRRQPSTRPLFSVLVSLRHRV